MSRTLSHRSIVSATLLTLVILSIVYPYSESTARLQQKEADTVICRYDIVLLTATVSDQNGQLVTDLRHTNFEVFDKGVPQKIDFFFSEDKPASVAIVYDLSASVASSSATWLSSVSQGILHFRQHSNESSEYTVIGADRTSSLITDWTNNSDALMEGFSRLALYQPQSRTGIYNACQFALKRLSDREKEITAVLLITDGASGLSLRELSDLIKHSNTLIYLICPPSRTAARTNEQKMLAKLSLDSGAEAFFLTSDDQVKAAFDAIADNLWKRYKIGYYPSENKRDGSWHTVRVTATIQTPGEPNKSELQVRTQSGYYAPDGPR